MMKERIIKVIKCVTAILSLSLFFISLISVAILFLLISLLEPVLGKIAEWADKN